MRFAARGVTSVRDALGTDNGLVRHIDDAERRRRFRVRHGVAPDGRHPDIAAAVAAMTVLHATDTATVYLSLLARVDALTVADVDRALYDDRSLVRQLAMRRTLFATPRDLLPAVLGSAGARLAAQQRRGLVRDVERGGLTRDGVTWLARAEQAVRDRLAGGESLSAPQLRAEVPEISGALNLNPGTTYGGATPVAPRVLTVLSAAGAVVRGRQTHHWRLNRPMWSDMNHWVGAPVPTVDERTGYAELVSRWLRSFGPGTEDDVVWWLGATKGAVRRALGDVGAVAVSLDGGGTGWVLPDDLEPTPAEGEWVALLPVLDPSVMGWRDRRFLLGDLAQVLFDRTGNAGSTAWVDGRPVGCWVQDPGGRVVVAPSVDVPARARRALEVEAERITAWCDGVPVNQIWVSHAMKEAAAAI